MTVTKRALAALHDHWAVSSSSEELERAHHFASSRMVQEAVGTRMNWIVADESGEFELVDRVAAAYEFAAAEGLDALIYPAETQDDIAARELSQAAAFQAFELRRVLPMPEADETRILAILHLASLAYCGERWSDLRRWLKEHARVVHAPRADGASWDRRLLFQIFAAWVRLLRKDGWDDLNGVAALIAQLRDEQRALEPAFLGAVSRDVREAVAVDEVSDSVQAEREQEMLDAARSVDDAYDDEGDADGVGVAEGALGTEERQTPADAAVGAALRAAAFRLAALYHWARATELLAIYMLQGEPRTIDTQLDQHFEAAREAARGSVDPTLEVLLRWLHVAARRMAAGSVWWVAHSVNSRVTKFVEQVTKTRGLFELLPPQRVALREQGLLDVANRAVVVELPTSGGKTVLAQFRMLQALNQFAERRGYVAYVAPTRALVSQITRRLRTDFEPFGIAVEQLSAAVEVDAFEEALLATPPEGAALPFHILVTTPEKLQLVIRNQRIARPLALVVMDEAHNIEDEERGLRIELLLATIKRDCLDASFLLLTPFIDNAKSVAAWLSPEGNAAISLGTTEWRPNERIVGTYRSTEDGLPAKDWQMAFETLTTMHRTIHLRGMHRVGSVRPFPITASAARSAPLVHTGAMALAFGDLHRTSIAVARSIPDVWRMARRIAAASAPVTITPEIGLVQRFLQTEVSPEFELVEMLGHGVGVHHAGLSEEARALIEWLAEEGQLRVLCATSTVAQGINFPVSSVFLASLSIPKKNHSVDMSPRAFWNLAGRAGRMDQDSVGVVGIADNPKDPTRVLRFVGQATGALVSRLTTLLSELDEQGTLHNLTAVIQTDDWADFRSYVAHLWNEKRNLDAVLAETEQFLRSTFGYRSLQSERHESGPRKAKALLDATREYVRQIAKHPENAALADTTGFAPEGVRAALLGLQQAGLERKLTLRDWTPTSLFGEGSALPRLVGVMLQIPEIRAQFADFSPRGDGKQHIANVARAWVGGQSLETIARQFFLHNKKGREVPLTDALTAACKGVYRTLAMAGSWGMAALTKMPTSGVDFEKLTSEERRLLNTVPAMLYHGVRSEAAVLMRMNSVPRTMAEALGEAFETGTKKESQRSPSEARAFLRDLGTADWERYRPAKATMSGADYRAVWAQLSGETTRAR